MASKRLQYYKKVAIRKLKNMEEIKNEEVKEEEVSEGTEGIKEEVSADSVE